MDFNEWIEKARESINELECGTTFVVKDLFQGADWNNIPVGDRRKFGSVFKNEVMNDNIIDVEYIEPTNKGPCKYRKTGIN